MELEWKLIQSGTFPESIPSTLANLRAALVVQEAKAEAAERTEGTMEIADWATEVDSSIGLSPATTCLHPACIAH